MWTQNIGSRTSQGHVTRKNLHGAVWSFVPQSPTQMAPQRSCKRPHSLLSVVRRFYRQFHNLDMIQSVITQVLLCPFKFILVLFLVCYLFLKEGRLKMYQGTSIDVYQYFIYSYNVPPFPPLFLTVKVRKNSMQIIFLTSSWCCISKTITLYINTCKNVVMQPEMGFTKLSEREFSNVTLLKNLMLCMRLRLIYYYMLIKY